MGRLTKKAVDDLVPRDADYVVWCDGLPGFGIRVFPSGKRAYCIQYRAAGRSRRVSLGLHGRITADEARRIAKQKLGDVAKGSDPAAEKAATGSAMTMAELCGRYRKQAEAGTILGKRGGPKRPLTLASDWGRIDGHIIPLLGTKAVRDITRADINGFIRDVTNGRTARRRKTDAKGDGRSCAAAEAWQHEPQPCWGPYSRLAWRRASSTRTLRRVSANRRMNAGLTGSRRTSIAPGGVPSMPQRMPVPAISVSRR